MNLGDSFLNHNPGSYAHLWIVASNPSLDGSRVIFNVTTWHDGCDESCILQAGDHPFVHHTSFIAYRRGQLLLSQALEIMQKMGYYQQMPPVSRELLYRIQSGALKSDFTAQRLQKLVRESMIEPP